MGKRVNINKVDKVKNTAEKQALDNECLSLLANKIKPSALIRLVMVSDGKIFVRHC